MFLTTCHSEVQGIVKPNGVCTVCESFLPRYPSYIAVFYLPLTVNQGHLVFCFFLLLSVLSSLPLVLLYALAESGKDNYQVKLATVRTNFVSLNTARLGKTLGTFSHPSLFFSRFRSYTVSRRIV